MRYGIIDIGSNTVRAVVYDVNESGFEVISNIAVGSKLFAYTKDAILTEEGKKWLYLAVTELVAKSGAECDFCAFATSAFRDLENRDEVKEFIEALCNVKVYILRGEEEAECDRAALVNKGIKVGVAVDLGGGSCQIIAFDEEKVSLSVSLPLGCVRLKMMFSENDIPNEEELKAVYAHSEALASEYLKSSDALIIFGGTARTLSRLAVAAGYENSESEMSTETLEKLIAMIKSDDGIELLKTVAGKRYETVPVGATTLLCIARGVGAGKLVCPDISVRDGFLVKYIL